MRVALLLPLLAAQAVAQTPVETAARQRQDALQSVDCLFRLKTTRATPAKRTEESEYNRLAFSGEKAVLELHTDDLKTGALRRWMAATDGERVTATLAVYVDNTLDLSQSGGEISPAKFGVCRDLKWLPLTLAARGLDPVHCPIPADGFTPTGTAEVRGRACDEYTATLNEVGQVTAWFDPAAGHTLRRLRTPRTVIEVESSNTHSAGVWLPKSWTVEQFDPAGKRTKLEEFNVFWVGVGKKFGKGEFVMPWSPGMRVADNISGGEFTVEGDGSLRREVDPWETVWRVLRGWWVWALALGVLTAGVATFRTWRTRKRRD